MYWRRSSIIFLVCIVAYWLAASIFVIEERDLWLDEGFTLLFVKSSTDVFWDLVLGNEMNMLPYYIAVRPFALMGLDAVDLRYLSLVPAVATILLMYRFSAVFFSQRLALLATFFIATNPLFIRYSGELRAYSLTMLLCLAGVVTAYVYFANRKPTYLYVLAVIAILAFYSGFLSLLVFGFIGALLLIDSATRNWAGFGHLVAALAMAVLALAPGFWVILTSGGQNLDWITPASIKAAYRMLYQLLGAENAENVWAQRGLVLGFAIAAFSVLFMWLRWLFRFLRQPGAGDEVGIFYADGMHLLARGGGVLVVGVGTLAAGFIISLVQPMMVLRYFTMVIPFLVLVLAVGLTCIPRQALRLVATALFVIIFSANSLTVFNRAALKDQTDEWPKVVETLMSEKCTEDTGVIFYLPIEQVRFNAFIAESLRDQESLECLSNVDPKWFHIESGGLVAGVDVHKHIRTITRVDWAEMFARYSKFWVIAVERPTAGSRESQLEMFATLNDYAEQNHYVRSKKVVFENTTMLFWEQLRPPK